jgi:putative tryptophan/tyrosine transport system substrate-binding protein
MQRREVVAGLGASALMRPLGASAQQQAIPTIGWLDQRLPTAPRDWIDGFRRGLGETGFIEGRTVSIISRFAEGHLERLPALAADLVTQKVAVIVGVTGDAALAAKAATRSIPVVFFIGGDPVEDGIVASLNHPGGNVTGVNIIGVEIAGKRLDLLHKLVPTAERIALLSGRSATPFTRAEREAMESAAGALGVRLLVLTASAEEMSADLSAAFATIAEQRASALIIGGGVGLDAARTQIISLAARHAIPTMFFYSSSVPAGGLLSYGPNDIDDFRQVGIYAGRILKGERPADLPVVRSVKFELAFNLRTANTLGLTIPPTLLALADRVIE